MKKWMLTVFVLMACFTGENLFAKSNIIDFEIEVELENNTKYDIEYEVRGQNNNIEARYAMPGSVTLHGKNAVEVIEPLFQQLNLKPNMNIETLKTDVLSILKINEDSIIDFEIEIKFSTGYKIKIDN